MAGPNDATPLLLTISADTSKALKSLDKLSQRLSGLGPELEGHGRKAMSGLERSFGKADVGKALDNIFDRSKVVFTEGAARIPIFGAAVESLGPAGLAAAAGISALAIAGEQARKAMEWADQLQKTAQGLGVTTDSLQKFDYAAVASSIGVEKGREALKSFDLQVGKFQSHIGDGRFQKWAEPLKLSRTELNQTTDKVEKLALVLGKIAALSNSSQRRAAATAFGLDTLLPIINQGGPAIEEFIGKMREAQAVGGVINASDIAKAAEMNEKVEALSYLIGQHFKQAFIDAAPAVEKVAEFIETCTKALAGFIASIPDAIRGLQSFIGLLPHGFSIDLGSGLRSAFPTVAAGLDIAKGAGHALAERGRTAALHDSLTDLLSRNHPEYAALVQAPNSGAGKQLVFDKPKKGRAGPQDDTLQRTDQVNATLSAADRELLQALAALTTNVEARAAIEKQVAAAEAKEAQARVQKQIDEIAKDKGIKDPAVKARLTAELELVKAEQGQAAIAKQTLIARQAADQLAQQALKRQQTELDGQAELLQIADSLAETASERRAIELKLLDLADRRLTAELEATIASQTASDADIEIARLKLEQLKASRAAREGAVVRRTEGPLARFEREGSSLGGLQEGNQASLAQNLDGLAASLADATLNTHNFGKALADTFSKQAMDILTNTFRYLLANLTQALQQQLGAGGGGGGSNILGTIGKAVFGSIFGGSTPLGGDFLSTVDSATAASITTNVPNLITSASLPAFATGGSFVVGGMAGIDRNLVQLRASRGERVTVETPEQQRAGAVRGGRGGGNVSMTVVTQDADSFRRSQRQVLSGLKRGLSRTS